MWKDGVAGEVKEEQGVRGNIIACPHREEGLVQHVLVAYYHHIGVNSYNLVI